MAINFYLTNRTVPDLEDPMDRTWYGWDPYATDDELWAINRGVWRMSKRPLRERFATLSHDGAVQVVAEITGREQYGDEWALTGVVLRPGDPVRDALVGRPVRSQRNPVSYFDTSVLDAMTTAERARLQARGRVTVIATWNPASWAWDDRNEEIAATEGGGIVRGRWATGSRRSGLEPGDRAFLLKQGAEPRGVVGSGTCSSRIFQDDHWDHEREGAEANYVLIEWDTLLPDEDVLPHSELIARVPAGRNWQPQGSGTVLPPIGAVDLEALWAEHLEQVIPVPPRTSPRQGWQLDHERRRRVEDAAQTRLEDHFRDDGWDVRDVRYGNPFDAIATRSGELPLYLEAKGTETAGSSVIVSRGEVNWARNHPGQCVLGILSNVSFLATGEVDSTSGLFRMFKWDPDKSELAPRDYDWTPPPTTTNQWP